MVKSLQFALSPKHIFLNPPFITLILMIALVAAVILANGGDPLALARIGTIYDLGDPQGTEGYDGQFVYYVARDPDPTRVARYLDVPAYRYQRILLPLLGRALAFGSLQAIPWTLAALGILSQFVGTWLVSLLLASWRVSRWYALIYGLWVGFGLAIRLVLPEPLAYALVAGAILSEIRGRRGLGWLLHGLALFAKEVAVIFVIASLVDKLTRRKWRDVGGLILVSVLPFAIFQFWLWQVFGQTGFGSGGAMATSFELIPYMGLFRIGFYSPLYLVAMLIVFAPSIIFPSVWGIVTTLKKWISGDINVVVFSLFFNALAIAFLPFSTFRETGGLLRFSCGLVLSAVLYCGYYRNRRILNYGFLWLVLNLFLVKS